MTLRPHRFVLALSLLSLQVGVPARPVRAQASATVHLRRGRLLGVYDAASGAPLDDVTVVNMTNGLSARTTASGALSLFFVDTLGGLLKLQKLGYRPMLVAAGNSDRDTVGMTVLMERVPVNLSTVVTRARSRRGPADTIVALEKNGFYDRRISGMAASSSFLTHDQIKDLTILTDVQSKTPTPICFSNVYLDGVRITGSNGFKWRNGRVANNLSSSWLDQLLEPDEVLAVELYLPGEVPQEYNQTRPPGQPDCGATLIWTRR